ncbi:MAG: alpha/beta fold hydrolase [Proteobacteria bacterium]|nr:alpha/beta fold hydrolase [Pseudomonadota bacterium]
MIHGIVCNGAVWNPLRKRLSRVGFAPIRAINLEPMLGDLDSHAMTVASELRAMQQHALGARVTIVAHSMGGLVARAALRLVGTEVVDRIVTVASPHHGTLLARYLGATPLKQLRPDCAWLRALNGEQEGRFAVPLTSIYSLEDALVAPPRSAALRGAELRELRGVGHLGILRARRGLECIMQALQLP